MIEVWNGADFKSLSLPCLETWVFTFETRDSFAPQIVLSHLSLFLKILTKAK
jgi:hypothetical protein